MASHAKVVSNWIAGKHSNGYAMSTDGSNLYSYNKVIGRTLTDGTKQALDLHGYYNVSASTSKHSTYANRQANETIYPRETDYSSYARFDFPIDSSIVYVRATSQTWKTLKGVENALKGYNLTYFKQPVSGGYSIFFKQYVNSIGKVVSDAEYWSEMHE